MSNHTEPTRAAQSARGGNGRIPASPPAGPGHGDKGPNDSTKVPPPEITPLLWLLIPFAFLLVYGYLVVGCSPHGTWHNM